MTTDPDETGELALGVQREWTATVVGAHRLREDTTVVRLIGEFVPFAAGQSVEVRTPQHPNMPRRMFCALPPSLDGKLEFHVRTVPGGWCSGSIVSDSHPGDEWRITAPAGGLIVDPQATDVVMIADGIGLAPLRALLLDVSRRPEPPRTHLFVGARYPRDLYAADMLYLLTGEFPWLTVIPVVQDEDDPARADQWYEQCRVDLGFSPAEMVPGTIADIPARFGPLDNQHILICAPSAGAHLTADRLVATGTDPRAIRLESF